ncbi:hypothetical protein M433DRAFT_9832 [Acidomyces richmondensis BFW]|nr:hypothetical protein M433DRAFT_9832 [Acidomyces richmondensis BFW]
MLEGKAHPILEHLDKAASALTKAIQTAKAYNKAYRALRRCSKHLEDIPENNQYRESYKTVRNSYFQAIKAAK